LVKFRESPDQEDEDEEEKKPEKEESSEDEAPVKAAVIKKEQVEKVPKPPKDDDESDDSFDWGSDSDSDTDSSEEQEQSHGRERFLKKPSKAGEEREEKDDEKRKKKSKEGRARRRKDVEDIEDDEGWKTVTKGPATSAEKPKMFAKDAEIDIPLVMNKLNEIMAARGKKRTDRRQQIELLYELKAIAEQHNLGNAVAVKIRFNIVSAIYDYNPKVSEPMKLEYWTKLLTTMQDMMKILLSNKTIHMSESVLEENEDFDSR